MCVLMKKSRLVYIVLSLSVIALPWATIYITVQQMRNSRPSITEELSLSIPMTMMLQWDGLLKAISFLTRLKTFVSQRFCVSTGMTAGR